MDRIRVSTFIYTFLNESTFFIYESIIPPSFELSSKSYDQMKADCWIKVSSWFVGYGDYDYFLKNIQDLMITNSIYIPFIDVIFIIFWLDFIHIRLALTWIGLLSKSLFGLDWRKSSKNLESIRVLRIGLFQMGLRQSIWRF